MTAPECTLTDLPPEMCSHCKGLDKREKPERAVRISEAWFDSYCPNCARQILARDPIGLVDREWLCGRCFT